MEKENEWFRTLPLSLFFGNPISLSLIHHQGIICGVAFDRSFLRRIAPYASVVAPRRPRSERDLRLASNALLVIRRTA
jgi:hypothetical protein